MPNDDDHGWNDVSWLYGFQSGPYVKVGIARNLAARLNQMRLFNPFTVKIILRRRVLTRHARRIEICLHKLLWRHASGREWFFGVPSETLRKYAAASIQACAEIESEHIADYNEKSEAPPPVDWSIENIDEIHRAHEA